MINELKDVLNIPAETRMDLRCSFNNKGLLTRLYLNGLSLNGVIDIAPFTKHLSVLVINDNPKLKEARISSLSPLAAIYSSDAQQYCCEMLDKDKEQNITLVAPIHEASESPFAHLFLSDDMANANNVTIEYDEMHHLPLSTTDLALLKKRIDIESELLQYALIGKEFTSTMQQFIDRTNIGSLNKGLRELREIAKKYEQDAAVRKSVLQIRTTLKADPSSEDIKAACAWYVSQIWGKSKHLSDRLMDNEAQLPLNRHNYGITGLRLLKSTEQSSSSATRLAVRDGFITDSGYGKSFLRIYVEKYTDLANELIDSISNINFLIDQSNL